MNSTITASDAASYFLKGFGRLFYVVSPAATSFSTLQEVPDYIAESIPFFIITIVMEFITLLFSNHGESLQKKRKWDANRFSINDAVGSIGVSCNNVIGRRLTRAIGHRMWELTYNSNIGRYASADIQILHLQHPACIIPVRIQQLSSNRSRPKKRVCLDCRILDRRSRLLHVPSGSS